MGLYDVSEVPVPAWGPTLPPVQWVKRLESEADHCYVSSTEAKNEWSYTITTPYTFVSFDDFVFTSGTCKSTRR
jgi:hypothetical protein